MSIVAVVSMKGGVGKTSTTANLAAAIALRLGEGRVCTVDLDPQNGLQWYFGRRKAEHAGICSETLQGANWRVSAFSSPYGVRCLPYGAASEEEREAFERLLSEEPTKLQRELERAGLGEDQIVLLDLPPGPSVYLNQGFACADLVLIVLLADAGSYATIMAMEAWLDEIAPERPDLASLYLLNQVDQAAPLNHDIAEILRQRLGARLLPISIHRDEAVGEALAFLQPVVFYDPGCQATDDFRRLAEYLLGPMAR